MSALRYREQGARWQDIPKKEIPLGSLPPFEYNMLRAAIRDAIMLCGNEASALQAHYKDPAMVNAWLDRATEYRALQRRFIKRGRRGVSA